MKVLLLVLVAATLSACETDRGAAQREAASERNRITWQACLDRGGVPIQSFSVPGLLSECVFPPAPTPTEPPSALK